MRAVAECVYLGALDVGCVWKKNGTSPSEMARLADKRMYADKRRHYCDRNRTGQSVRVCRSASAGIMQKAL